MAKDLQILFLDDDQIEYIKLSRVLKSKSHSVTLAKSGDEALEKLKEITPDIIIMDLNMPGTGGLEFLKIIKGKEDLRGIPAIVMTTTINKIDMMECYRYGIAGYFLKPLKYQDYEHKINLIVDYWSENENFSEI